MTGGTASRRGRRLARRVGERLKRSISEFLAIPILIVGAFFALALVIYVFDHDAGSSVHWGPLRSALGRYVGDGTAASGLLTTIAGSLITVTSITFSILLLAVQQGASALTSQIIDHYLRRPSNRVYFGFFVGTSVFALVTLVLTTPASRPVLGVTLATVFTGIALFALILLIYSTIDQIRPVSVITTIHDAALSTRAGQRRWLAETAPVADEVGDIVTSDHDGYLTRIRIKELQRLAAAHPGCTITIVPTIGEFVGGGRPIARLAGCPIDPLVIRDVRYALPVEQQRDIGCDAAYSVDHLVNIAWTAISTAKSNPAVGIAACHALSDIVHQWSTEREADQAPTSAIRYRDETVRSLFDGMESLVVVTSESMQHQTLATILDTFADVLPRARAGERDRIEQILLTSLPALGDHLPTRLLEASMRRMGEALAADGRAVAARQLETAWQTPRRPARRVEITGRPRSAVNPSRRDRERGRARNRS